jgi:NAD-dependent dihydropyrimidine dehydrogenase PreA subunit
MKSTRKIIEIDETLCDGCGQCIIACAEGALEIIDGKAKVISENLCDGLGACIGDCPTGALEIIERDADEFDEGAVEAHLAERAKNDADEKPAFHGGCPSAGVQIFDTRGGGSQTPDATEEASLQKSALSHWPVQIRLIPPSAPFLAGANLLVMADCVPVAFPTLHRDFLDGKAVAMGCPKFDNAEEYIQKFSDIFRTANLKTVTVVVMEVPCCSALPKMVEMGMEKSGTKIPVERVVISTRGKILKRIKG